MPAPKPENKAQRRRARTDRAPTSKHDHVKVARKRQQYTLKRRLDSPCPVRGSTRLGPVGPGRVGSGRVGSVRVGSGLFWSGRYGSARFRSNRPDSPGGLHLELVPLAGVSLENRRSQVLLSHLPVPRAHQRAYAVHLQVGGWTGSVIGRGQGGGW